jgi:hypothetical protein
MLNRIVAAHERFISFLSLKERRNAQINDCNDAQ